MTRRIIISWIVRLLIIGFCFYKFITFDSTDFNLNAYRRQAAEDSRINERKEDLCLMILTKKDPIERKCVIFSETSSTAQEKVIKTEKCREKGGRLVFPSLWDNQPICEFIYKK